MREILPKEFTIESTIYSGIFFKEINGDGSLHVLEHCQHNLLYWHGTYSLPESQCVSIPFLTQACSRKSMFSSFVNILFYLKHASLHTSHILL